MTVPDLTLERFVLGELPAERAGAVRATLEADPVLRARVDALDASADAIAARTLAAHVRARLETEPAPWRGFAWLAAAASITIAAALFSVSPSRPAHDGDRIKGPDATLAIYRQTASGSEQLDDRALAHEGDVIRIGYRVNDDGFGTIVSVDGRGTVTVHYPDGAPTAAAMRGGQSVLLTDAYELDDAPKWERFYIITAAAPFPIDPIVTAAKRAGSNAVPATLDLGANMTQATFLLHKDSRP